MNLRELPRSALLEIGANKTRSALTCVSLSVGIAAILFTFSQVLSMQQRMDKALDLAGRGRIDIWRKGGYVSKGLSSGLTIEDADAIRQAFPELYMVYPMINYGGARIRFQGFHTEDANVFGTNPEWAKRDWVYTLYGRFINDQDMQTAARSCVLVQPGGWKKKPRWATWWRKNELEEPLKHQDLVGREIEIDDHVFTVVGVIKAVPRDKDPRWFISEYDSGGGTAIVPVTTYRRYFLRADQQAGGQATIDNIEVDTGDNADPSYPHKIESLLLTRHRGEKDFEMEDLRSRLQGIIKRNRDSANAVLIIGVIAILAGGVGILNVTLATTYSRIREIGIRRSLGATQWDIIFQFITEAMLLGFFGGLAGIPLGLTAIQYLSADPDRVVMPTLLHLSAALLISIGTGLAFSLYPAWQASAFDPIEALRYE